MHVKRQNQSKPNCKECSKQRVALIPENYHVFSIIEQYGSVFADGEGKLNVPLIKEVIQMHSEDAKENIISLQLIILFYKAVKQTIGDNNNVKK